MYCITCSYALSGCDTTTTIGTNKSAFQTAKESGEEYLKSFAKSPINDDIVTSAEKFLVEFLSNDKNIQTFHDLCFQTYHKKSFQLDLENLPCMSNNTQLHIKCSFLQCYRWLQSPFVENIDLEPMDYKYIIDEDEHLLPEITR